MLRSTKNIIIRTPLQSINNAYKISSSIPVFEEGLYLASPEFWEQLSKRSELNLKDKEKVDFSFKKYWLRSTSRSTPYGTFAGSSLLELTKEQTSVVIGNTSNHHKCLRLDMNYVTEIVRCLIDIPSIKRRIKFFPNNSIYSTPEGIRYAEYFIVNNNRSYQLTSIKKSSYLDEVLLLSAKGATLSQLSENLINKSEVKENEAIEYIESLLEAQLLVAELEPCVTGQQPLSQIIDYLEIDNPEPEILSKLKEIQWMFLHPEEGVSFYRKIEQKLKELDFLMAIPKNALQVDLFLSFSSSSVNKELIDEIVIQTEELKVLAKPAHISDLEHFVAKFQLKFEDSSLPLSIALDADLGVGYAGVVDEMSASSEYIDGLPILLNENTNGTNKFDFIQKLTLSKYQNWLQNKETHIHLHEDDLKSFKSRTEDLKFPNSMYIMGSLMKENGLLDATKFCFDLSVFGGPSAGNLLGRFTHGDEGTYNLTKEVLQKEEAQNPDAIYAEIVHLPQARIGNILLRPCLRNYEIPYVGKSGADKQHQITVEDLMVSVRNNEVILYSKRLNKRIIPRLTTAHNFGAISLPIYKFLCDLQMQGLSIANIWDWGSLGTLKHLPRVIYKNLIIHKARWNIEENDFADAPVEISLRNQYLKDFCIKHSIPNRVVYKEADNELLIDFSEDVGIKLFFHYINRYKAIVIEEFLFTEENCVVHNPDGAPYTNELIIPVFEEIASEVKVRANEKAEEQKSMQHEVSKNTITVGMEETLQPIRSFSPYSEWLYFKIYCGTKTAEKILSQTILPFIEEHLTLMSFEYFFFIRFKDEGGCHIRIRFYNSDINKQLPLFKKFSQALQPKVDSGQISKIVLDSYRRELERYMPELISSAEHLFHNDSLSSLRFLELLDGIDGERYRLLFAMRGIDMLLEDFKFSLEEKGRLLKKLQNGFFIEFGGQPLLQKQLNDRYRKYQNFIGSHMNIENDVDNEIDEAVEVFNIRSEMNHSVIEIILGTLRMKGKEGRLDELLSSYIHMFMNRLFIAQQRKYELVINHFLDRYYSSKIAIANKAKKNALSLL